MIVKENNVYYYKKWKRAFCLNCCFEGVLPAFAITEEECPDCWNESLVELRETTV